MIRESVILLFLYLSLFHSPIITSYLKQGIFTSTTISPQKKKPLPKAAVTQSIPFSEVSTNKETASPAGYSSHLHNTGCCSTAMYSNRNRPEIYSYSCSPFSSCESFVHFRLHTSQASRYAANRSGWNSWAFPSSVKAASAKNTCQ